MTGGVLIAHGSLDRAKRIGEACEALDLTTRHAAHGPAALEAALSQEPDVLVVEVDLPVVGAGKLVEILRANPRTQHLRVFFLGAPPPGPPADTLDAWLPSDTEADILAAQIEATVALQERLREVERGHDSREALQGRLTEVPLSDLLQLLALHQRTGRLDLTRLGEGNQEERGEIQLLDGTIVEARVGSVDAEKAFYRLLAWEEGSFVFTASPWQGSPTITLPTRALLLEGARQLDEWERVAARLPRLDAHASLQIKPVDLPDPAHPLTQEVLTLLESHSRVQELLDQSHFPDYQVLRTLQTLVDRGMVQLSDGPGPGVATPDAPFGPVAARRLRDWLQSGAGGSGSCNQAKVLLVASEASALTAFLSVLDRLPSCERRGGTVSPTDLATVAHLPIDASVACSFLHLPRAPLLAPLRALAAHGALATIFLLHSPATQAMESLREIRTMLEAQPRARQFHVLMLDESEGRAGEDLRASLEWSDEASLFLMGREDGREAVSMIRKLLARVLP